MLGTDLGHATAHKETSMAKAKQDTGAGDHMIQKLAVGGVFSAEMSEDLRNTTTKDQATEKIQESRLYVEKLGNKQLQTFIHEDGASTNWGFRA